MDSVASKAAGKNDQQSATAPNKPSYAVAHAIIDVGAFIERRRSGFGRRRALFAATMGAPD
jgi:hypothetical protein